jgi:hypothetical protein
MNGSGPWVNVFGFEHAEETARDCETGDIFFGDTEDQKLGWTRSES